MNPFPYIRKFFSWIGFFQNRESAIKSAQLQLAQEQHRAEVFALELSLRTTETERDSFKTQAENLQAKLNVANKEIERLTPIVLRQPDIEQPSISEEQRALGHRF